MSFFGGNTSLGATSTPAKREFHLSPFLQVSVWAVSTGRRLEQPLGVLEAANAYVLGVDATHV